MAEALLSEPDQKEALSKVLCDGTCGTGWLSDLGTRARPR